MLALSGSRQVTWANGPASFLTTLWQLILNFYESPSRAKSFIVSCLVVTNAILTALSITGSTIY